MEIDMDKVAGIRLKDNRDNKKWMSAVSGPVKIEEAKEMNFWKPFFKRDYDLYRVSFTLKNGYEIQLLVPEMEVKND